MGEDKTGLAVSTTPDSLLQLAVEGGADMQQLEKLLELKERWDATEARKAYVVAMTKFKADPPKINKDMHVKFETSKGWTEYNHASLANVTDTINSALSIHGLSAGWETSQDEKGISVTCTITHILGHKESTRLVAGADASGGKNNIQAIGSTVSYLERYTILALTGLASKEMDNDGGKLGEPITEVQANAIYARIEETKADNKRFLVYMKVECIEEIPADKYDLAMKALDVKAGPKKAVKDEA